MTRPVLGVLLVLAACGRGKEQRSGPPAPVHSPDGSGTAPGSAGSPGTSMSKLTIAATVTATRPGRPPLERLIVDLAIDNAGDAPRWVAIPKQVPHEADPGDGVDSLELRGTGAALFGTFRGNGGVYALRVAGKAKVTISDLEIGWWQSDSATKVPDLAVAVADDLTIGGKPAKDWFGVEPLVGDGTRFDAAAAATGAHASQGPEQPIALTGATTTAVALTLPAP